MEIEQKMEKILSACLFKGFGKLSRVDQEG